MVVEDVVACGSKQTAWEPLKVPERGLLVEDSLGFEAGVYLETPNFFWNHPISSGPYCAEKLSLISLLWEYSVGFSAMLFFLVLSAFFQSNAHINIRPR